ncbi:ABC transporter permease [Paenibacillus hodogayensis]|uniref:ABC transporter permease n=1 Tax=Paenibacillus hodogayensis TaxID=279208 RepID=A0ABV5W753_9BACL
MYGNMLRKEMRELLFSVKGAIWLLIATFLFSALTYSFVTVKELSRLAQVEIVMTFMKAALGFGLLVTVIIAAGSVAGEKEQGTLESLMLAPLTRFHLIAGKWLGILGVWSVVAAIAAPYMVALSLGTSLFPIIAIVWFGFGTLVVAAFSAIAISISSLLHSSRNAILLSVSIFFLLVLPVFLGTTMKRTGFGSYLDAVSPLSGVMRIMKSLLVDKQSIGFALAHSLSVPIFALAAFICLGIAAKKLTLLGGE